MSDPEAFLNNLLNALLESGEVINKGLFYHSNLSNPDLWMSNSNNIQDDAKHVVTMTLRLANEAKGVFTIWKPKSFF